MSDRFGIANEGAVAALVGSVGTIIVLAIAGLLAGESILYAPWALGTALQGGDLSTAVTIQPILLFTAVHVGVLIVLGMSEAAFIATIERHHVLWYLLGFIVLLVFLYGMLVIGTWTVEVRPLLSWPFVILANVVGLALPIVYLSRRHGALIRRLRSEERA